MPDFPDIIGVAGLALAVVAFYLGFKRHRENTTSEDKRHREAMKALADRRQDAADRHERAMTAQAESHKEAMKAADRRERALEAIIRNTAPRPGPAE